MKNDNMDNEDFKNSPLVKRGFLFLEDSDWEEAKKLFNDALNQDPENANAYIGLLLAELKLSKVEALESFAEDFSKNKNYEKALRFADDEYRSVLVKYSQKSIYNCAIANFNENNIKKVIIAKSMFESIGEYGDSSDYIPRCEEKVLTLQKKASQRKKKIVVFSVAVLLVLGVIILSVLVIKTKSNKIRADSIYQNFLGKSFVGSYEDDQGFVNDYKNNKLKNQAYFKTKETYTLHFNEDGTIDWQDSYEYTLLAAPEFMQDQMKRYERTSNNEGTASSFSVRVALDGTAYITISFNEYQLRMDGVDSASEICNYGSLNKTNLKKQFVISQQNGSFFMQ